METLFDITALCEGNQPITGGFCYTKGQLFGALILHVLFTVIIVEDIFVATSSHFGVHCIYLQNKDAEDARK